MRFPVDSDLGDLLGRATRVVVFTGAGVSAESGVPTFRDALTGLWERFDPAELATMRAFRADPGLVWGWYEWRRAAVLAAAPNPAHHAIAALERAVPEVTVVTQNVDDLHERAGSTAPLHLHGSLFTPRCAACAHPAEPPASRSGHSEGRIDPPRCTRCGRPVRPGVVWFGESLPEAEFTGAMAAAERCDVLLSVGTSSLVYPAAEIPVVAARAGATVIQVNPGPTPLDQVATVNLRASAATVLPVLVEAVWPSISPTGTGTPGNPGVQSNPGVQGDPPSG
jgi:NAD-dependent deacetylase